MPEERPFTPVLFHFHGIGTVDFSSMTGDDLAATDQLCETRGVDCVPTVFLRREYLADWTDVLKEYTAGRAEGRYQRILGFAMEGPLLGTSGGVPPAGCWAPTVMEWRRIAALGELGLTYVVIGPDGMELDDEVEAGFTFRDLVDLLYRAGIKLALGHFEHDDPVRSARRTAAVIDHIQRTHGPSPYTVITDHLYNDMPRKFVHALRGSRQRAELGPVVERFASRRWTDDELDELLGPVPATLLREARKGRLTPVLNFDGQHVDLRICARTVEYLGAEHLILITDDTEVDHMAGEPLEYRQDGGDLWYRGDGRVAAGRGDMWSQVDNLRELGLGQDDIESLVSTVPRAVLRA